MKDNLYNIIQNNLELSENERLNLAGFLSYRCREKTYKRLKSICLYGLHTIELCGILRRLELNADETWSYCAGQSYTDEMRTVREVVLGKI